MANSSLPIPQKSLMKILVCLAVIIIFAFFFNIQSKNKVSRLNGDIVALKSEIKRQEILYPVYLDLKRQYEAEVLKELPLVTNKAMTQEEVNEVTRQIEEAAMQANVEPQQVIPDPATLAENSGQVIVNCEFFGPFFNIRDLLKSLGGIPYVRHIETLQMQEALNGLVVKMKVRLSVVTEQV